MRDRLRNPWLQPWGGKGGYALRWFSSSGHCLDWSFGAFLSESDPEKPDDLTMNRSLLPLGESPDALVEIVRDA